MTLVEKNAVMRPRRKQERKVMVREISPEAFIKKTARAAGRIAQNRFGLSHNSRAKSNALDVVTESDMLANALIIRAIKRHFPQDGIISEETGKEKDGAEHVWIIDPIDGTLNYSKGIPFYAVLIARKTNGLTDLACVYDPVHNEMYFAKRGAGAYLNGKRIHCSTQWTVDNSCGLVSDRLTPSKINLLTRFYQKAPDARIHMGSIHCAGISGVYVADGRKDWNITTGHGHVWDYAAPFLIAEEAGCKVTDFSGKPWNFRDGTQIVIANPILHTQLLEVVRYL